MVANFDPRKRQQLPILDVQSDDVIPPTPVDIMASLRCSLAKQSLIDMLDAMSRQQPDFLGEGWHLRLNSASYSAAAVWALDWVMADTRRRGYGMNLVGVWTFTVKMNGRTLITVERTVTA